MPTTLTPHEALVYIMITTSAADGRLTDLELGEISTLVEHLPVFSGFTRDSIPPLAEACVQMLGDEDGLGLDRLLEIVKRSLTPLLHETAYALAVEVAAVDQVAEQEELRFLEMMRDTLEIDMLVAAAIERSARVRYRRIT
jgi:tellurite resistance protein